jgi:hypothetical protein
VFASSSKLESFPAGRIRYSVRNLGERPISVCLEYTKEPRVLGGVTGPLTRAGFELRPGLTFEHDAGITQSGDDVRIVPVTRQL